MSVAREAKLGPDVKLQITLAYENNLPVHAKSISVSIQHPQDLDQSKVKEIIYPCPKGGCLLRKISWSIQLVGFVVGGPVGDCGF